jgi:hypothetical protein
MSELTIVDNAINSVGTAGEAALDAIVGGAALAADAVSRPRRAVTRARRRGSAVNREVADAAEEVFDATLALPERLLITSLRGLRSQAARRDALGGAARTLLAAVHVSSREAARFFARVERSTAAPARRRATATLTTRGRRSRRG